jgi:hypothetical protein
VVTVAVEAKHIDLPKLVGSRQVKRKTYPKVMIKQETGNTCLRNGRTASEVVAGRIKRDRHGYYNIKTTCGYRGTVTSHAGPVEGKSLTTITGSISK